MKWKILLIILAVLCLIAFAFLLLRKPTVSSEKATILTIWDAPATGGLNSQLDFSGADRKVQMARQGFVRGLSGLNSKIEMKEILVDEDTDVGKYATNLADIYASQDIVMAVGAVRDESTMYASIEMNFFNIPMLIPFSDGDLTPENSSTNYSIRMSPTAQKYADFFNTLFTRGIFVYYDALNLNGHSLPDFSVNVAVYFANNFNGNNTAVNITQTIMDNGYNVETYNPYAAGQLAAVVRNSWVSNEARMTGIDAVVIIGEDGDSMRNFSEVYGMWHDRGLDPIFILVGYAADDKFDPEFTADNVYVVHQSLDFGNCPADITSRVEALGYAAGYVVSEAFNRSILTQEPEPSGIRLWFLTDARKQERHQEYLNSFRNNLRTTLLEMDEDIPCFGHVDFDANMDNLINLELVHYTGLDSYEVRGNNVIIDRVLSNLQAQYGDLIDFGQYSVN